MAAHPETQRVLDGKRLTYSTATAGITTLTAGNTTLSMQDLKDIIHACEARGEELVFSAGALKIRPKDSTL